MPKSITSIRITAVLAAAAALYGSSLACDSIPFLAPTATPTSTSTPSPTATPTVTPTRTVFPIPSDIGWPVYFSDSFDDQRNNWFVGDYSDPYVSGTASITGGKYLIDFTAKGPFSWWPSPTKKLEDFYLSVEVTRIECPKACDYGLVFRYRGNDQYIFTINVDHQDYRVMVYAGGEWTTLIDFTESSQIAADSANQIAVKAEGVKFTFFINGEVVNQIENDVLDAGRAGVGLMSYRAGDHAVLEFDNFEVRAPEAD